MNGWLHRPRSLLVTRRLPIRSSACLKSIQTSSWKRWRRRCTSLAYPHVNSTYDWASVSLQAFSSSCVNTCVPIPQLYFESMLQKYERDAHQRLHRYLQNLATDTKVLINSRINNVSLPQLSSRLKAQRTI